jgi:hypothetical protein
MNNNDTQKTPGQKTPVINDPARDDKTTAKADHTVVNDATTKREPQAAQEKSKPQR